MAGRFDDTLKNLTELSPDDWVIRGGWEAAPTTLVDADIATISGAADKVIRVAGQPEWLLSIDFQAGHDSLEKLPTLLLYNSALFRRHGLPVRSLLVLLHKGADSSALTGLYERGFPAEPFDVTFRYHIVRVWQVSAEKWLSGGLGHLPLAPLGDVKPGDLPAVINQIKQRVARTKRVVRAAVWSATYILMGLRYERAFVDKLLREVGGMKESATYRAILEEGEAIGVAKGEAIGVAIGMAKGEALEARKVLLMLGRDQLGEPSNQVQEALNADTDVHHLNHLIVSLKHASSWEELLGKSRPRRHTPRRKSSN